MDFNINLIFSDCKCPLFTRLGGGVAERGQCHLFYRFFTSGLPLVEFFKKLAEILSEMGGTYF